MSELKQQWNDLSALGFAEIDHEPLKASGKPYKIYAQLLDATAQQQFADVLNYPPVTYAALMPDAHGGYTMPIGGVCAATDVIVPQFVGFDIGCGMCAYKTEYYKDEVQTHAAEIYQSIVKYIPLGFNTHRTPQEVAIDLPLTSIGQMILESVGVYQLGSLGGGNHFIEIGHGRDDAVWIVIHSGSRGFGHKIASHYMLQAYLQSEPELNDMDQLIAKFEDKNQAFKERKPDEYARSLERFINRQKLEQHKRLSVKNIDKVKGIHGLDVHTQLGQDYITDQNFALAFALANRQRMIEVIVAQINRILGGDDPFDVQDEARFINRNHNHAEFEPEMGQWIHRKGATHAKKGMRGVIPGNMRDGSFVVIGKGNADSLESSSHGAGRVMSRVKAKSIIGMDQFKASMQGITGTVDENTLDESPFAYKNIFEVMALQEDLVEVVEHIQVLINVKDNTPGFGAKRK